MCSLLEQDDIIHHGIFLRAIQNHGCSELIIGDEIACLVCCLTFLSATIRTPWPSGSEWCLLIAVNIPNSTNISNYSSNYRCSVSESRLKPMRLRTTIETRSIHNVLAPCGLCRMPFVSYAQHLVLLSTSFTTERWQNTGHWKHAGICTLYQDDAPAVVTLCTTQEAADYSG